MGKASAREVFGFNDFWFILGGTLATGIFLPTILAKGEIAFWSWDYLVMGCVCIMFTLTYWLVNRKVILLLRRRYPGISDTWKRVVIQATTALLVVVLVNSLCKPFITTFIENLFGPQRGGDDNIPVLLISLLISIAVLGIYEAIYMLHNWRAAATETERLRKENILAQLNSLKAQVNPHFLFNSLNTLTSIVHEDPDLSVEFIKQLSTTYRHLLDIRDQELIPLREEMECVRAYLFLLKTRFGESLILQMDVPDHALGKHIIPLSLQMLVENAIKHNVVSRRRPLELRISISSSGTELEVVNNKQPKLHPEHSTGTGLENINSRYALISDRTPKVQDEGGEFSVTLPLFEINAHERTHP